MSDETIDGPDQRLEQRLDQWLVQQHEELGAGLSRFLDLEAGLRETRLYVRHAELLSDLGDALDVEGGLAEALRAGAAGEGLGAGEASAPDGKGRPRGRARATVRAVAPRTRLAVRGQPAVVDAVISDLLVRAVQLAIVLYAEAATASTRHYVRFLVDDLARAQDLVKAHAFEEDFDLDLASEIAGSFSLKGAGKSVYARARDIVRALHLVRALDRDRVCSTNNAIGLVVAPRGFRTFLLALSIPAGALVSLPTAVATLAALPGALSGALASSGADAKAKAQAVGSLLALEDLDGLAAALLQGALDDFTDTDLTGVDLTGVELLGLRWSEEGTRWPQGTDIGRLRRMSKETSPGSGVYVIVSGGTSRTKGEVHV